MEGCREDTLQYLPSTVYVRPLANDNAKRNVPASSSGGKKTATYLPEGIISKWTKEECTDFLATIGLQEYSSKFIVHGISGDALIALQLADLREVGVASMGHRLRIAKKVYDLKIKQGVRIENDDYIPPTIAHAQAQSEATARIANMLMAEQLQVRDKRITYIEEDLTQVTLDLLDVKDEILRLGEYVGQDMRQVKQDLNQVKDDVRGLRGDTALAMIMASREPTTTPPPSYHA